MNDDGAIELESKAIMDTCWVRKGASFIEQSLVKWKRLPREDATWEDTELLKLNFPDVDLEDKGPLQGGALISFIILAELLGEILNMWVSCGCELYEY